MNWAKITLQTGRSHAQLMHICLADDVAAGLFGLAIAELVAAVSCAVAGGISFAHAVDSFTVTNGTMGLAFTLCGLLLAWHRPRNPVGWLFLAAGVAEATSAIAVRSEERRVGQEC